MAVIILRSLSFSQNSRSYTSFNVGRILLWRFLFVLRLLLFLFLLILLILLFVLRFLRFLPTRFGRSRWRWRRIASPRTAGALLKKEAEDVQEEQDAHAVKVSEESLVVVQR